MKFCTFLWKKTATQKIFCIAVMQKCIANCDAIPGKLFPAARVENISLFLKKCCNDASTLNMSLMTRPILNKLKGEVPVILNWF